MNRRGQALLEHEIFALLPLTWPYSPTCGTESCTGAQTRVQPYVIAGLTVFNGGGRRPVQRVAVVIEITFRVRFVPKTVEITKVVVR